MNTLGISCYYPAAACLVADGDTGVSKERFTRIKNNSEFPENAIAYCLEEGPPAGRSRLRRPL